MKYKGHISQTYIRRDNYILPELYKRAKNEAEYPTSLNKIFRIMADLPTDRYYISDDAALIYVRKRYLHGEITQFRTPERQRLYESLYAEVMKMMEEERYKRAGIAETTICALMRPAPCVGLSPEGIRKKRCHSFKRRKHDKV